MDRRYPCRLARGAKEEKHGEQASLPPRTARVEVKGTGRRADVRLSGVREDTRQAATREDGVAPEGAAWVIPADLAGLSAGPSMSRRSIAVSQKQRRPPNDAALSRRTTSGRTGRAGADNRNDAQSGRAPAGWPAAGGARRRRDRLRRGSLGVGDLEREDYCGAADRRRREHAHLREFVGQVQHGPGLRMSIPTLTVGIWLSWRLSLNMVTYLSGTSCSSLTCAQVRLD
jgi:hypothetical protein